MQLPHLPLVVLDTETTGFLPKINRIIEYAHIVVRAGNIADEYEQLISIPDDIPGVVQAITRITPPVLEGKPAFEDVQQEIFNRIGSDTIIVGQNIGFDIRMLAGEGIDLTDRPWIDTSMLASLVFPEFESYSLGYMSTLLELHHAPVHRALGDVRATLELLEQCWIRLLELPQDMVMDLKSTMSKSSAGYNMLFHALPSSDKKDRPLWMKMPAKTSLVSAAQKLPLAKPEPGVVELIEEPLDPHFLQNLVLSAAADESTVHWIAVKNLSAIEKRLQLPKNCRILQPPFLLPDSQAIERLQQQQQYTADEATLLTKLHWYTPQTFHEAPIHGDERSVWSGKIACTDSSPSYTQQFSDLPSVLLLDHRQLLQFLKDPEHEAHGALTDNAHIIIDDASMLEDTAGKAYGEYFSLDRLRAASEGDAELIKFTDLLALWIEKTRNGQDVRYITEPDLTTPEASSLRGQLSLFLCREDLPLQTLRILESAAYCLEEQASSRISWIETRQDGKQTLHSIPESVAELLKEHLYDRFSVTLLIPPESAEGLQETLHRSTNTLLQNTLPVTTRNIALEFSEDLQGRDIVSDPPDGKTIILAGSRRIIEEYYVDFVEELEHQGVTLLCQNMSGGQSRMQAEFLAAHSPCVWVLTPWTFEGIELPHGSVDHLILDALPFDNPSQPVFSKRSEHFSNGFIDYSMPRLLQRLFRILRTFVRIAKDNADILVIDSRITQKRYGSVVKAYLERCCTGNTPTKQASSDSGDYPEGWQMNLF